MSMDHARVKNVPPATVPRNYRFWQSQPHVSQARRLDKYNNFFYTSHGIRAI